MSSSSEEMERRVWEIVERVPGINLGYGTIRLVVYISKGNKEEAIKSAVGVGKGVVQTAAVVGSAFLGPLVAPVAAGALSGIVTESIQGIANVIICVIDNTVATSKSLPDGDHHVVKKDCPTTENVEGVLPPLSATKAHVLNASTIIGDEENKVIMQKISESVIQLLSRKVLEAISEKKMTFDFGTWLINAAEKKSTSIEIVMLEHQPSSNPSETKKEKKVGINVKSNLKRISNLLKKESKVTSTTQLQVLVNDLEESIDTKKDNS